MICIWSTSNTNALKFSQILKDKLILKEKNVQSHSKAYNKRLKKINEGVG